jgi:hypothetical protein
MGHETKNDRRKRKTVSGKYLVLSGMLMLCLLITGRLSALTGSENKKGDPQAKHRQGTDCNCQVFQKMAEKEFLHQLHKEEKERLSRSGAAGSPKRKTRFSHWNGRRFRIINSKSIEQTSRKRHAHSACFRWN